MTTVLVVQALAKQYRLPFFDGLHDALAAEGVRLKVAYGDPPSDEGHKQDDIVLGRQYGIHVGGRWLLGDRLFYQPVLPLARRADLVIVEHANKQLVNLPLLLRSQLGRGKLAFWGQGRNVLCAQDSLSERIKARTAALADWWFAYTAGAASYLTSRGARPETVTVVQNAIDSRALRADIAAVTGDQLATARAELGLAEGDLVGLFCGSLYAGKKIDFLIDAVRRVRAQLPGFHLVVVGAGPAEAALRGHAAGADWIHFVGRQSGAARAVYFRLASAFLIPAFVGLAVVDAFAAGLPVITTELPRGQGVEMEYIEHGGNGLVTAHDSSSYAAGVVRLLADRELHGRLSDGAARAGNRYTIEAMVENFAGGVLGCLRRPRRPERQ